MFSSLHQCPCTCDPGGLSLLSELEVIQRAKEVSTCSFLKNVQASPSTWKSIVLLPRRSPVCTSVDLNATPSSHLLSRSPKPSTSVTCSCFTCALHRIPAKTLESPLRPSHLERTKWGERSSPRTTCTSATSGEVRNHPRKAQQLQGWGHQESRIEKCGKTH